MISERYLCNLLMEMYGKCGSVEEAEKLFRRMPDRNVYSWNIIITALAKNGQYKWCAKLFWEMDLEGVKPSEITFLGLITAAAQAGSAEVGTVVHARVVACGFGKHVMAGSALVHMLGKCGLVEKAREVFETLTRRNVVSWTSLIGAYAGNGYNLEALSAFRLMDVAPSMFTYVYVAKACGNGGSVSEARDIEVRVVESGVQMEDIVGVAVVDMFCRLGSLEDARRVFDKRHRKNVSCRNLLITAYTEKGGTEEALELYRSMQGDGVEPDCVTFLETLGACSGSDDLPLGHSLHENILKHGFQDDELLCNALITMYGRCGSLEDAASVFSKIRKRSVVSWTTMIAAYAHRKRGEEALLLFRVMDSEGVKPNEVTFVAVLNACSSSGCNLGTGRAIHHRILSSGFQADDTLGNALVDMYGKCRSWEEAKVAFDKMNFKDVVTWTTMISAYAQNGCKKEAFKLYEELPFEATGTTFVSVLEACEGESDLEIGKQIHRAVISNGLRSDVYVGTSLIDMYGKCGSLESAREAFDGISSRNVVSWNALMAAYVQNNSPLEALQLYHQMDLEPDKITFISALDACGAAGDIAKGRAIHQRLRHAFSHDILRDSCVGNALLRMYAGCGDLAEAKHTFGSIPCKNLVSWNELAGAFSTLSHPEEALKLFSEMELQGVEADENSVTCLLSACSHAGLKLEGWNIFLSMDSDFGIRQSLMHYVCIVDVLGRVGQLEEAEKLINTMPLEPGLLAWMTFLSSCSTHGDIQRGSSATQQVLELNQRYTSAYILLSKLLALGGVDSETGD